MPNSMWVYAEKLMSEVLHEGMIGTLDPMFRITTYPPSPVVTTGPRQGNVVDYNETLISIHPNNFNVVNYLYRKYSVIKH